MPQYIRARGQTAPLIHLNFFFWIGRKSQPRMVSSSTRPTLRPFPRKSRRQMRHIPHHILVPAVPAVPAVPPALNTSYTLSLFSCKTLYGGWNGWYGWYEGRCERDDSGRATFPLASRIRRSPSTLTLSVPSVPAVSAIPPVPAVPAIPTVPPALNTSYTLSHHFL